MADPTVADVFDQLVLVNGKLDQINLSTTGEANAINKLDSDVNKGFKTTIDSLKVIAQFDLEAVKLLFHLTQQVDAMICALEHISKNTCGILTQVTMQTPLQTRIRDDADVLRDIAESAYPQAGLARHRLAELRAEVERCCPPEKPTPACIYEPCPQPKPVQLPHLPKIPSDPEPPKASEPK
jgi:hypothetical protein